MSKERAIKGEREEGAIYLLTEKGSSACEGEKRKRERKELYSPKKGGTASLTSSRRESRKGERERCLLLFALQEKGMVIHFDRTEKD